jgi:uncharacterized protein (TIGR02145 family)
MSKIKTTLPLCVFVGILSAVFISTNTVFADNLDYSVNVQPSMTVTIPTTTVNLDIDPSTSTFDSEDVTVTVGTNNPTGYSLSMSSEETDLTLDGGTETISTLDTLEGGYTLDTFTTNRWGYKLPTTNYLPFATNIVLDSNDAPVNARTSTVTFAAKADFTKPSGTYKLAINFTAVANYVPPTPVDYCVKNGVADANCMQKMVASNCTTTAKIVMDSRDGERYKVQRLADGKCWLLDNLRLDPTEPQVQVNLSVNTTNASDQTLDYFLNGGGTTSDKYPTAPLNNEAWTSSSQNYYSIPMTISTYKDQTTASYGSGSGKIGVYYNFCAASAGSYCYGDGTSASTGDAGEDICPAGWRMPTGGADTVTTDGKGEYQALYTAYSSNATNFRNALSTPLSGGFGDGSAFGQGSGGVFWSSTRSSGYRMYLLNVSPSKVDPQHYSIRNYGNSVRCLLR